MASLPFPGLNEADLVAKASSTVVQSLRKAKGVPPWPDTHESLLELYSILYEWHTRAEATTRYAAELTARRLSSQPASESGGYSGATNVGYVSGPSSGPLKNLRRVYISAVQRDTKKALYGSAPILSRLFPDNRRRVLRRGLRTILAAYCPELLQEFEESTNARIDWVNEHRREFEKWFDQSRTDDEVAATLTEMVATQEALQEAMGSLRDFIMKNFPLPEKSLPAKFRSLL
jgi:hypothetical protein